MYICKECGETFEEPAIYEEHHGLRSPPYEKRYCCPFCGGDYAETRRCCLCGDIITGEYTDTKLGWICDGCGIREDVMIG
jgi:hypothetical protein